MDVVERVTDLIKKPVTDAGYLIDDISYQKEDGTYYLRVIIDKTSPITIDDCVIVSKIINPLLDEADLELENYILDVCSK